MSKAEIIQDLRAKISHLECGDVERCHSILPAPSREFAAFLPDHGLRLGTFIEIIEAVSGSQSLALGVLLAKHLFEVRPRWAVFDWRFSFNPVAATCAGSTEHLTIVRADASHAAWIFSQLLKSREIGLSLAYLANMDNMVFRRFQLSAERGEGLGVVVRPFEAAKRPSWASLRLLVEPQSNRLARVSILHSRGTSNAISRSIEVEL